MQVEIEAVCGVWAIRGTDGCFKGETLATAESLSLSNVSKQGKRLYGTLMASWGVTVLNNDLDDFTRLNLHGRRAFNYDGCKALTNLKNFRTARRLIINGNELMGC